MGMEKKVEAMVLSLSFEVEVGSLEKKNYGNPKPYGGIYRVPY